MNKAYFAINPHHTDFLLIVGAKNMVAATKQITQTAKKFGYTAHPRTYWILRSPPHDHLAGDGNIIVGLTEKV